jgi:hypothetical protein
VGLVIITRGVSNCQTGWEQSSLPWKGEFAARSPSRFTGEGCGGRAAALPQQNAGGGEGSNYPPNKIPTYPLARFTGSGQLLPRSNPQVIITKPRAPKTPSGHDQASVQRTGLLPPTRHSASASWLGRAVLSNSLPGSFNGPSLTPAIWFSYRFLLALIESAGAWFEANLL